MNDGPATCAVCDDDAPPRAWLRCMLCGRRFHFAPEGQALHDDCGIVAANPESENGC
ncbi:MAG: hypothetical protein ACYDCT_03345 [Dehalococcoidia bacterium]